MSSIWWRGSGARYVQKTSLILTNTQHACNTKALTKLRESPCPAQETDLFKFNIKDAFARFCLIRHSCLSSDYEVAIPESVIINSLFHSIPNSIKFSQNNSIYIHISNSNNNLCKQLKTSDLQRTLHSRQ
jgi:hypothetical protein